MGNRKDWTKIIDRLNHSKRGRVAIDMGSPGSAQVTRVRLLKEWNNVDVSTSGYTIHLSLGSTRLFPATD